jgi:hypothetical protein
LLFCFGEEDAVVCPRYHSKDIRFSTVVQDSDTGAFKTETEITLLHAPQGVGKWLVEEVPPEIWSL